MLLRIRLTGQVQWSNAERVRNHIVAVPCLNQALRGYGARLSGRSNSSRRAPLDPESGKGVKWDDSCSSARPGLSHQYIQRFITRLVVVAGLVSSVTETGNLADDRRRWPHVGSRLRR